MNRAVKGALLVLVVCLLSFSLSSCFAVYKLMDPRNGVPRWRCCMDFGIH
jgi:hypothetical protein